MDRMKLITSIVLLSWLVVLTGTIGAYAGDDAAIRSAVKSYVEAFNRGDASAIAALWSEDAQYVTPRGLTLKGRKEIKAGFEAFFSKNKGIKLQVTPSSISFPAADRAVEEGAAVVTFPGRDPAESSYEATYTKQKDSWKLVSVKEAGDLSASSGYSHLKDLKWMIGDWVDRDETATVETTCRWTKNKNFMTRSFSVSVPGRTALEGTQIIGWDPAAKTIKSWVFDSAGGIAEGVWTKQGNSWIVRASGVLGDGARTSSISVFTYIDNNKFTWRSSGREVGGVPLPNIDEVTVVRKQTEPAASAASK